MPPAALFKQRVSTMKTQPTDDAEKPRLLRMVRLSELPDFVGLHRSQIFALIADGEFPKPVKLSDGGRANGWLEHELIDWQQKRIAKRDRDADSGIKHGREQHDKMAQGKRRGRGIGGKA
jgi:prophage regulatory protein